ncbi:hypothetical protein [Pontibacter rugosus]|uniref:6-phosphogluconate dehydrogenase NADP-binding domain-containing protein n=1 Tax=Pontibacter rugosus TaxID=1745966 RepID=A0ABW3SRA8_9BACT
MKEMETIGIIGLGRMGGNLTTDIIATRVSYQQFSSALNFRTVDDIKTVIEWNGTD